MHYLCPHLATHAATHSNINCNAEAVKRRVVLYSVAKRTTEERIPIHHRLEKGQLPLHSSRHMSMTLTRPRPAGKTLVTAKIFIHFQ